MPSFKHPKVATHQMARGRLNLARQKVKNSGKIPENAKVKSADTFKEEKIVADCKAISEVTDQFAKTSASLAAVKAFIRKKIAKRIVKKSLRKEIVQPQLISMKEPV